MEFTVFLVIALYLELLVREQNALVANIDNIAIITVFIYFFCMKN